MKRGLTLLYLYLKTILFFRTFAAGNKIKQFYELLVEDSLRREDVDSLSRENMKNLHEIMQSFRFSNVSKKYFFPTQ